MTRMVLVADDSPTIQKRALGILKGQGFEVETVSNGVAAIKRLAVLHPVVILADVSMPGRDGYEVCEFVKKSAELSQVPVLLVASDMEPYDDARGAEVRADGIIKKPFEPYELISIVVKFADQFEAAMSVAPAPAVAPPEAPEHTQEFAAFSEAPEESPTVVQHMEPDFSAASGGVAFAEPAVEEAPVYSPEPQPAEMEVPSAIPQAEAEIDPEPASAPEFVDTLPAPEPQSAVPAAETPLAVEEPPTPSPFVLSPPPPPPTGASSFLEGLEATAPEPVFIEEQSAQASESPSKVAEFHTMIFRAPLEIAEPVWKDETVAAPPVPEPPGPTTLEPQLEAEAPAAAPEIPVERPLEPPHNAPSVTATSLDSFSLDDATAGQVHFASESVEVAPVEVAHSVPAEGVSTTEIAAPESALEAAYAEIVPPEAAPVAVYAETTPPEPPPEAAYAETAAPEATPEAAYAEIAPPEAPPEAAYAEASPTEAAPGAVPLEPPPEAASPLPAFDWGLVYSIVHKVVVKMSPPVLPMEVVEEMAKRLAVEIATEITNESSHPPA